MHFLKERGVSSLTMESAMPLIVPAMGDLYAVLYPLSEMLLRVVAGFALVLHGLRMTFGYFPDASFTTCNLAMLAEKLDNRGYRPGKLWAAAISATQLGAGLMFTLGIFTRLFAIPIVIFLIVTSQERWRAGGYFWNQRGMEYPLLWTTVTMYFLIHGGGLYSLDQILLGGEF